MRKLLLSGIILAGLALALFLAVRFQAQPVEVRPVERGTAVDAVPATVEVQHASVVTLSAQEGGRILESELEVGRKVEAGDFLVRIDTDDLEIQAEALRDRIRHLETLSEMNQQERVELARAKEELENKERLFEAGNYPKLKIVRRRREFEAFKENQQRERLREKQELENLRHQLKRIELRIERSTLHAPTSGIIDRVFAFAGEVVHARNRLATIQSEKLFVTAKINEENFRGVRKGLSANVRFLTYGDRLFPGKVSQVLPGADPETQQYTVFLDVDVPEKMLLPGLSGEASIIRDRKKNTLLIPRSALFGGAVFVAEDGKAHRRPVEVGARGLNRVEIVEGLEPGETVVLRGAADLRDGDRIRIR